MGGGAVHRDLTLLHCFQQARLGARGGSVDFVGEDDIGEQGTFTELEVACFLIVKVDAGQVGRQQVRGELDAFEFSADGFGKGAQQHRFAGAGYILQQHMTGAQKAGEYQLNRILLAYNDLRAVVHHSLSTTGEKRNVQKNDHLSNDKFPLYSITFNHFFQ